MQMYQQVYLDVGTLWLAASFDKEAIDEWFRDILKNGLGKPRSSSQ